MIIDVQILVRVNHDGVMSGDAERTGIRHFDYHFSDEILSLPDERQNNIRRKVHESVVAAWAKTPLNRLIDEIP